LGRVAAAEGQYERATQLLGAAAALRETIGAPLSPGQQSELDNQMALVRTGLAEGCLASAWAEGRAMTLEQAIAHALENSEAL
jgi:hypothetical protein